jgi:hypothetical protein
MASAANPQAKILIYAVSADGRKKRLFQGVNEQTGPSGSPDGVQGTVKANELPFMPVSNWVVKAGEKLVLYTILTVADGIDASDCVINVPIMRNGNLEYLSAADFNFTVDLPASTPTISETQLGTGYTVPESDKIMLGGGNFFISIQNDTA